MTELSGLRTVFRPGMGYLLVWLLRVTVLPLAAWAPAAGLCPVIGSVAFRGLVPGLALNPAACSWWIAPDQFCPTTLGTVPPPPVPPPCLMFGGYPPVPATGGYPAAAIAWSIRASWSAVAARPVRYTPSAAVSAVESTTPDSCCSA